MLALALLAMASLASTSAAQTAAIHAHLLWSGFDRDGVEAQLDKAKAAGAGMVRVDLGWASLEQDAKGRYSNWYLSKIDHVVDQAEARRIKVLFTFWETPCWASTAPEHLKQGCKGAWWNRTVQRYPPARASDYGDALAFVVRRYGSRVAAWELWNEPNHDHYFKARDKVSSYARLVRAAYPAAKDADPSARVVAGSLADADFEFTDALYARGVKGHFDAWSVHPYSEDRSPLHPGIEGWSKKSFVRGVPAVRATMLRHGDDKPLWLTEFGWSTCTVRDQAAYENCVDPATQAEYLRLAFGQMQAWSYVPVGVWFNMKDTSSNAGDRVDNYGLLRHDGSEKPAYRSFRDAARALAGPARTGVLVLRAVRRRGRVLITGRLPAGRRARVKVYRWRPRARRFSRRPSYRLLIPASTTGRFRLRVRKRELRRGKWLIVVEGGHPRVLTARTRLR
jgi:polysaccharide biosynthesis protein PslG